MHAASAEVKSSMSQCDGFGNYWFAKTAPIGVPNGRPPNLSITPLQTKFLGVYLSYKEKGHLYVNGPPPPPRHQQFNSIIFNVETIELNVWHKDEDTSHENVIFFAQRGK